MTTPLLLSIPDSCVELGGISRTTLYELINNGHLVKVNIGTRGFITGQSLTKYVESLTADNK